MTNWNVISLKPRPNRSLGRLLFYLLISFFIPSCEVINPEEPVASYLYIPSITLEVASDGSEGSASHDIQDAWVMVNGELIGVFGLPAMVPVLKEGPAEVSISAGIKRNGISNDRVFYPFYAPFTKSVQLIPGRTDTIVPVVRYRSNLKFVWIEDFEDGSNSFTKYDILATQDSMFISEDPGEIFSNPGELNRRSAKILLDTGEQYFHNATANDFILPRGENNIYLEVNYRCEVPLQFGIVPTVNTVFGSVPVFLAFSTGTQWKKAYISLQEDVNTPEFARDNFKIFLAAISNRKDRPVSILIDNLKIIHFE